MRRRRRSTQRANFLEEGLCNCVYDLVSDTFATKFLRPRNLRSGKPGALERRFSIPRNDSMCDNWQVENRMEALHVAAGHVSPARIRCFAIAASLRTSPSRRPVRCDSVAITPRIRRSRPRKEGANEHHGFSSEAPEKSLRAAQPDHTTHAAGVSRLEERIPAVSRAS